METTPINVNGINELVHSIQTANKFFLDQTQRQVNTALTLRNWVIGYYIVEYEQEGADRAEYGERFYETEAIVNNWSVRELERAIDSMLYERTGLSKDKEAVLGQHRKGSGLKPVDIFRSPYFLDFLGLEEKASYVETDLEQAIIDHLQAFLIEMGRGFCFEARQKRITIENTHYRIDLVFYHRLLRP